jgi:hypothetical protein
MTGAIDTASFRLLGAHVRARGPAGFVRACRLVFARFAEPDTGAGDGSADLAFDARVDGDGFRLTVERDGRRDAWVLASEAHLFGHAYARILDDVTRRDPHLLCVHAAAVARGGAGLALAAPSGHGKSTLALALASRGFTFLSDEVAPIDRRTGVLHPFPMAVGCRPGTHALLGGTLAALPAFEPATGMGKALIDPTPAGAPAPRPVPLRALFFVEPPGEDERVRRRFRLHLHPPAPAVARDLAALDGVAEAREEACGAALVVALRPGAWAAPAIEACLARARTLVSAVEDLDAPRPDFSAEPRLERLGVTEGVLATLRHLRGFGALQDLARDEPGGFGGLLVSLAGELRGVAFYRLTPGRLDRLVAAVESAL